ncbi:MAG: RNA polymerase sigma factor [Deltaproteobacteria bacterium]|nr:RNA polymerase sigma factor [Deltaproteobacteria bacterium]
MALNMAADTKKNGTAANWSSDAELTQAAADGDPAAKRALVERLMSRVRATTRYLAGGHADAEDYAQLSFVEILQSAKSFRGDSPLESWADRIVVRTTMRYVKQLRWRSQYLTYDSDQQGTDFASAEDDVARQRVMRRMSELFADLKPKQRAVVTMRLVLGYSIAEIAEATGANPNTVRYRLNTGRKKLRRRIEHDPQLSEMMGGF